MYVKSRHFMNNLHILLLLVSLHHTFVIHCFTHLCAVSLYISRSSVVHTCGRSGQFSKCSIVCGSSVQSHVVSSSQYPHLFIKRSQNILEILSHHQIILCSLESMANSTYKHPKNIICTAMDSSLKADLLEQAYAQPYWLAP